MPEVTRDILYFDTLLYYCKSSGLTFSFTVRTKNNTCCCCCCLHIKSRSGLYSVLSNIRTGPTDADAFRGHRLTTQKGYTYQKEIKGPRKVNTHAIIGK